MKYYLLLLSGDPKVIGMKQGEAQSEIIGDKFPNQELYNQYTSFAFPQISREEAWRSYGTFPKQDIALEHVELRAIQYRTLLDIS